MSEVVKFGVRELWVVNGDGWSLPIFCDPYTCDTQNITHWAVRPGLEMLAGPFTELSTRFSPRNLGTSSVFWIVTDKVLRDSATKATGCLPEDYMNWAPPTQGKESSTMELVDQDREDKFLSFCCQRAGIDMPLGRFVWRAIKEAMIHWFKNTQKPIDFELFEIHPMPYRANWKEIMLSKHRDSPKIFRRRKALWRHQLIQIGFIEDLGSTDLLAMNKNKTFSWGLEIKPKKWFTKEMNDGELARLQSKGPVKYARYYESSIRRRLDDILDVYAGWLEQVELQVGTIRESHLGGAPILMPESKRHKVLPSWHRPGEVTFQPDTGYPQLKKGQRKRRYVEGKIKEMLKMPNILPRIENLRGLPKPRAVDGPKNNGDGASGVRVPDAIEVETEACRLLAEGEGAKQ